MKYFYENFTLPSEQSFSINIYTPEIKRYDLLRAHASFEIALTENCIGKHFIGDNIQDFEGTQLVLMGSYLPHCYHYYHQQDPSIQPQITTIHFAPDFLGKPFLQRPEATPLNELFIKASKGVLFNGSTVSNAKKIMQDMLLAKGLLRISLMLQLLDLLSVDNSYQILSSPYYNVTEGADEKLKINKVFEYIFQNFTKEISLQEVANLVPMTPTAFCRFFKANTNRTLINFLKEIRISHAAKLLLEGKHNVTEACYHSGYNNLSNFHKHFKEVKGLSPRDFANQYKASA
ncbi:AraC family transcriptional regulator [Solitalea koreensis]|uniref:Transcriptional regulator, AraC family n=1 Tax=Solitalea koreensis TaxID=543615 RepID=A0A521DJY4_9SPHI|nr:AraC family transcriptional regulator [Solitalea koreensis]SMO72043.1 transcriptional regulator, AraC family [Solitalea koreensis]